MRTKLVDTGTLTVAGSFEGSWNTKDVVHSFCIFFGAGGLARSTFMSAGNAIFIVLRAKTVSTHTEVGSVLVGTGALALSGIRKSGWYTKDVIKTFRIILRASSLAGSAFFGSGDTVVVVFRAKIATTHTVMGSVLVGTRSFAFSRIGESAAFTFFNKNHIKLSLVFIMTRGLALSAYLSSWNAFFVVFAVIVRVRLVCVNITTKIVSAHALVVTVLDRTHTLARGTFGKRNIYFSKNIIETCLVLLVV
jgi:hypothetical protein